jgi:hypothetical protein
MGGKRLAALKHAAPGHAAGAIAQPRGGRLARRKLSEIDRVRCGGGEAYTRHAAANIFTLNGPLSSNHSLIA